MPSALVLALAAAGPAVLVVPLTPAEKEHRESRDVHAALVDTLRNDGVRLVDEAVRAEVRVRVVTVEVVTREEPDPRPKKKPVKVRTPGTIWWEDRELGRETRRRWNEVHVRVRVTCADDAVRELDGPVRETSARDAGRAVGRAILGRLRARGAAGACEDS
jgi:hypothetical protein